MIAVLNSDHRMAGTIKFDKAITPVILLRLLEGIRNLGRSDDWIDLHIRSAGDDGTRYIAFHYRLADGERKTKKRAEAKLLEYIKGQLGNKPGKEKIPAGVLGWSIATVEAVA